MTAGTRLASTSTMVKVRYDTHIDFIPARACDRRGAGRNVFHRGLRCCEWRLGRYGRLQVFFCRLGCPLGGSGGWRGGHAGQRERGLRSACTRSEEHTSELQSHLNLVCRLLLEKKKK